MLAGVAGGFALTALLLIVIAVLTRSADLPQPTATAQLVTAPPASVAPSASPAAITPLALETPTATVPPPPAGAGDIQIGAYVQVTGTGSDGFLNLRAEPSLAAPVNYLAIEREVFQVQAGPRDADTFVWWYLVDPATGTRFGWAVQNFLQVVQGP
jgi:hypothetical protein